MQDKFGFSDTLKMHIIFTRYMEYFENIGQSLLVTTDETVESVRAKFSKFEQDHGKTSIKKGSDSHRERQHWSVVACNSLNMGDK